MSQHPNQPVVVPSAPALQPESNGLGLAGFITSLVGLALTGGVLCPVGLIVSLIALSRRPRGFAVAGVVLGAVGSCGGCLVLAFAAMVGMAAVVTAIALVASGGPQGIETLDHMLQVDSAITAFQERTGAPPADLSQLTLPADLLKDGWGRPLEYSLTGGAPSWTWTLRTAGSDGVMEPSDLTFHGEWKVPVKP